MKRLTHIEPHGFNIAELLKSPQLLPGSFVDEALAQHHSDLLFQVPLSSGDQALAYILLEHKSSPDCVLHAMPVHDFTRCRSNIS